MIHNYIGFQHPQKGHVNTRTFLLWWCQSTIRACHENGYGRTASEHWLGILMYIPDLCSDESQTVLYNSCLYWQTKEHLWQRCAFTLCVSALANFWMFNQISLLVPKWHKKWHTFTNNCAPFKSWMDCWNQIDPFPSSSTIFNHLQPESKFSWIFLFRHHKGTACQRLRGKCSIAGVPCPLLLRQATGSARRDFSKSLYSLAKRVGGRL